MKRVFAVRNAGKIRTKSAVLVLSLFMGYFFTSPAAYGVTKNSHNPAAIRFAEEIFHKALIPKGAKVLKVKPKALPASVPSEAVGNLIDLHAFYVINMTKPRVMEFIKSHLGKGETIASKGSFYNSSTNRSYADIVVNIKINRLPVYLSELIYTFAPGPNAYTTYLRVDSNTVYLNPRGKQATVPMSARISMVLYTKPSLFHQATGKVNITIAPKYGKQLLKVFNSEPLGPVTVLCMENSSLYNLNFTWGVRKSVLAQADVCGDGLDVTFNGNKHVNLYESCSLRQSIAKVLLEQHLTKDFAFFKKFMACSS